MALMLSDQKQWTTETGKYRNYRNQNFGMVYRTETDNTEPNLTVYYIFKYISFASKNVWKIMKNEL